MTHRSGCQSVARWARALPARRTPPLGHATPPPSPVQALQAPRPARVLPPLRTSPRPCDCRSHRRAFFSVLITCRPRSLPCGGPHVPTCADALALCRVSARALSMVQAGVSCSADHVSTPLVPPSPVDVCFAPCVAFAVLDADRRAVGGAVLPRGNRQQTAGDFRVLGAGAVCWCHLSWALR